MSDIYIEVRCYGGAQIKHAIGDMAALADKTGVSVWCDLNGVRTLARPGDDPAEIYADWRREIGADRTYKIASAKGRTAMRDVVAS